MEEIITKKIKFTLENILKFSIILYIISLFVFNNVEGTQTNYISLGLFCICMILTFINCLRKQKIMIGKNFILYSIFTILGITSILYAQQQSYVFSKFIQLIINLGIIVILNNFMESKETIDFILKAFICAGLILAVLIIVTSDYSSATRYHRIGSQIGNVNSLAIQMCMALSATLIIRNKSNKKKWYIFCEIILICVILLTGSRKGILTIIAMYFMVYLLKNYNDNKKIIRNSIISLIIISIIIVILFSIPYLNNLVWSRIETLFSFINGEEVTEFSINARNNMIEVGWDWFKSKPVLGYGLDNYRYMYKNTYQYDYYAHNNYIELLVDLGIIGLSVYYLLLLYPIKKLWQMKLYKNYDTCVFFVMLIVQLIMDFAWVSYSDRVLMIYIALIYAYIRINDKRE